MKQIFQLSKRYYHIIFTFQPLNRGDVMMGDMMLTAEQAESFTLRKGVFKKNLWGGSVPFYITTSGAYALDASYGKIFIVFQY